MTVYKIKLHIPQMQGNILLLIMTILLKTNFLFQDPQSTSSPRYQLQRMHEGFPVPKKDFNLLEQTETLGVGYGCPEDSLVSTSQSKAF